MSRTERREFVVVGSGLLGLATAYSLGERGRDVLCLEQEQVGNERSGSKGTSRIFRVGYDDPLYVAMAVRAEQAWRALEVECGERLLEPRTLLNFGEGLTELMAGMSSSGGAPELVAADEVAKRFPGLAIRGAAVLDPSGAVLRADRALGALRSIMRAELRENLEVTGIDDKGRTAMVSTADGLLEASVVVVCAGTGSCELLRVAGIECRTTATLEQVAYFGSKRTASRAVGDLDELPVVIERVGAGPAATTVSGDLAWWADRRSPNESLRGASLPARLALYGLPSPALGWYKLGVHHTGPVIEPKTMRLEADACMTERLARAASSLIVDVDPNPRLVERCVYDNTADEHFVIDRIGRIVIGAGTSGHGFKFGPLLGSLLADLATGAVPPVALDRFSARRRAVAGS